MIPLLDCVSALGTGSLPSFVSVVAAHTDADVENSTVIDIISATAVILVLLKSFMVLPHFRKAGAEYQANL